MAPALSYHVAFVFAPSLSESLAFFTLLCHCCGPAFAMPCYTCHAVLTLSSRLAFVIDVTLPLLCGSASVTPHFICHAALPVTPCYRVTLPLSGGFTAVVARYICYAALLPSQCPPQIMVLATVRCLWLCHTKLYLSCSAVALTVPCLYHVACHCHDTLPWLYSICICNAHCICRAVLPLA